MSLTINFPAWAVWVAAGAVGISAILSTARCFMELKLAKLRAKYGNI